MPVICIPEVSERCSASFREREVWKTMLEKMRYQAIPLPDDIRRFEEAGEFSRALKLIEKRLAGELPEALRGCLELERELIPLWETEYPYSYEEALSILQTNIRDFTEEEFDSLIDEGCFEWIYREREMYFIRTFYENLLKVNHPVTRRLVEAPDEADQEEKQSVLNENMRLMKENGGNAYRFRIRTSLRIKEEARRLGETITVHLPIPTAGMQVRKIELLALPEGAIVPPEDFPSRTVCVRKPLQSGDVFEVEYQYETHMKYIDPDPALAEETAPDFFLEEQEPHILFTPFIRSLYREIVKDEKNPLLKAQKIYDYITTNVRYSYVKKYSLIRNIPEYAGINQKGDCGVQALLFITLCRFGGVPARWQSGLFAAPYDIGGHDWAQFYVEPYGWLFADLSFGGSSHRVGNEERRRFYFGNLDPFRMPANSEFQHEFEPPKKFLRRDPTDNQYGECEYGDRALNSEEYETTHEILEICRVPWEGKEEER